LLVHHYSYLARYCRRVGLSANGPATTHNINDTLTDAA